MTSYLVDKNMLVPYYMVYSYLYYVENISYVSDKEYDFICKTLYEEWDNVNHFHKYLIEKESLLSGTGYYLTYPDRVKYAALSLTNPNVGAKF